MPASSVARERSARARRRRMRSAIEARRRNASPATLRARRARRHTTTLGSFRQSAEQFLCTAEAIAVAVENLPGDAQDSVEMAVDVRSIGLDNRYPDRSVACRQAQKCLQPPPRETEEITLAPRSLLADVRGERCGQNLRKMAGQRHGRIVLARVDAIEL